MIKEIRPIEHISADEPLPLFQGLAVVPLIRRRRSATRFLRTVLLNPNIATILERLPELGVDAWLTAGCLVQTVWNVQSGRSSHAGIDDYDVIYRDSDTSWEVEDRVIKRANSLYSDLGVEVQVRNQARVPLWYHHRFGIPFPPVREAPHALLRYPSRATAIALTRRPCGEYVFYAPFGFRDALSMRVRPNRRLRIPDVYHAKTLRWRMVWPMLTVEPWDPAGD